jgi:hypothetical protein
MYLGSSQTYPRRLRLQEMMGNYFSASQKDNEELYNWNHVNTLHVLDRSVWDHQTDLDIPVATQRKMTAR